MSKEAKVEIDDVLEEKNEDAAEKRDEEKVIEDLDQDVKTEEDVKDVKEFVETFGDVSPLRLFLDLNKRIELLEKKVF